MSERSVRVFQEALALSDAERAELIDELISSFDAAARREADEWWAREAEERLAAYRRGEFGTVSLPEAIDIALRKRAR